MQIKNATRKGYGLPENTEDYLRLPLRQYAPESIIAEVLLRPACVAGIAEWAERSLETSDGRVSEVGGFVLGRYEEDTPGEYRISFEHFCPASEVEHQSAVSLVLGSGAGRQLADAMDEYPEYALIGWFHTHPGHTPYLSKTDLDCTHELFYRKPYQVAVVLDPLTPEFDTGIFARNPDGKVINKEGFLTWISWKKLNA